MPRRQKAAFLTPLLLDNDSAVPLHQQLFLGLRQAILEKRLAPNVKLPSTRALARDLSVSRNTVISAYDQLLAEGYLQSKVGAGSFISDQLPEDLLQSDPAAPPLISPPRKLPLSNYARSLTGGRPTHPYNGVPFASGLPELEQFPFEEWARLLSRYWRRPDKSMLVNNHVAGSPALRKAIADYLGHTRAVKCHADQVIIVSGSQQAIDLVVRVFVEPGDTVWMEEPGYPGTKDALIAAGAHAVPVPVDDQGLNVELGKKLAPDARLACISPSHQYPLGHMMSLSRRLALLSWAKEKDGFILEDDYDSEYRYTGRPLSPLQGLDTDNRVLYVGTMSKIMFSGLRMGYLVVPEDLVDIFLNLRRQIDSHPSSVAEAALAEFISEGYLGSHIRRMRLLYDRRQKLLLSLLEKNIGPLLTAERQEAGMHVVAKLDQTLPDHLVSAEAAKRGLIVRPLSGFYAGRTEQNGLILGFAGIKEKIMPQAVAQLVQSIEAVQGK